MRDGDYYYETLLEAYRSVGVDRGKTVFVAADLGRLMRLAHAEKAEIPEAHLRALQELLGPEGTIVVPTATTNLCNSDIPFDPDTTPSYKMGVFAEHVRTRPDAHRSFHPFWSFAAVGAKAPELVADVARHAYGAGCVWERLMAQGALCVHVGVSPRKSISVIHFIEMRAGVPYRYSKEFMHPVVRNGETRVEPFYLFVTRADCDIKRDGNRKIMDYFSENGDLRSYVMPRGCIWGFDLNQFVEVVSEIFAQDIFAWLNQEPEFRPFRQ